MDKLNTSTRPSSRKLSGQDCFLSFSPSHHWLLLAVLAVIAAVFSTPVQAIDSGSQLRRFQDETRLRTQSTKPGPPTLSELPPSSSQAAAAANTDKTHVAGFEVHGVTRFNEAEIARALEEYVGRDLSTADIHAAATALTRCYRRAGYMLAKVFVPPQAFGEVVRLDVEEGYLEANGIEVQNKGSRVKAEAVLSLLGRHLYSDAPLRREDLERALLLADDLPGTSVGSVIYPGQEVGTARLRTVMSDEPLISGNIDVDNFNNRQLGRERLGTTIYVNSPSGIGDQIVTRLVTSGSRSNYAYMTYLRPVSSYGTRIGASIDYFDYDANALYDLGKIDGNASDARLYLTHPLIRSRYTNLNLRTDLSHFRIKDCQDNNGFQRSSEERHLNLISVALLGDKTHDWLPNGITLFEASVTGGDLDIRGDSAFLQFDESGPKKEGGFARFNIELQRLQHVAGQWSVFGAVSGQLASGNLDSSQRFYLGGPNSVAGYPIAEIGGDQGIEIHAELRRDFVAPWGGNLQAGAFYEQGWVQLTKDTWEGWNYFEPSASNDATLQAVGLQLTQTFQSQWVIRGLIGWQIGSDDSLYEQVTGNNSDGRDQNCRVWFQIIRYFDVGDR